MLAVLGLLVAALALVGAAAAADDDGDNDPEDRLRLPAAGLDRAQTEQIVEAIRYVLEQADWKAGDYKIGFQSCDDATAQAGKWDSGKCSQNANAYARTTR